jgi:hypothetical protein
MENPGMCGMHHSRASRSKAHRYERDLDLEELEEVDPELADERRRREFTTSASGYGGMVVLVLAIWLLTGAGYFWPAWPIVIGALCLAGKARDTFANRSSEPLDAWRDEPERTEPGRIEAEV